MELVRARCRLSANACVCGFFSGSGADFSFWYAGRRLPTRLTGTGHSFGGVAGAPAPSPPPPDSAASPPRHPTPPDNAARSPRPRRRPGWRTPPAPPAGRGQVASCCGAGSRWPQGGIGEGVRAARLSRCLAERPSGRLPPPSSLQCLLATQGRSAPADWREFLFSVFAALGAMRPVAGLPPERAQTIGRSSPLSPETVELAAC